MIRSYRDQDVWKTAFELSLAVYRVTAALPAAERLGLVDQMRRASVSVAANIAEGHGRSGPREFRHRLSIASGSLRELETLAQIAAGAGFISEPVVTDLLARSTRVGQMLTRLQQRLRAKQLDTSDFH